MILVKFEKFQKFDFCAGARADFARPTPAAQVPSSKLHQHGVLSDCCARVPAQPLRDRPPAAQIPSSKLPQHGMYSDMCARLPPTRAKFARVPTQICHFIRKFRAISYASFARPSFHPCVFRRPRTPYKHHYETPCVASISSSRASSTLIPV